VIGPIFSLPIFLLLEGQLNGRTNYVSDELQGREEWAVAYFKALYLYFTVGTGENKTLLQYLNLGPHNPKQVCQPHNRDVLPLFL
jgi:hypothetical protein